MSILLSPPGNGYQAKNEYESSVFILGDNDIVLKPKNDVRNGFSKPKAVAKKSVILLFIVSILASLFIALPSKNNPALACGVTDPLACVTEATDKLTEKVVNSFRGIFCSAGDPAITTYPESAWAGTGAMMFPSGIGAIQGIARLSKGAALDTSKPYTAYEKYGTSGTNFTYYRDKIEGVQEYECVPFAKMLGNSAANGVFSMTETIASFTGWVYSFAVATDAFSGMINALDKILGTENSGIIGKLYIDYMAPMIMLGALYAMWFGIVKRAFTIAGSGILWMLLSIVCGLSIMYNASGFVNFSNGVVQSMVSQTTGVIGGLSADTTTDNLKGQNKLPDLCSLPGEKVGGTMKSKDVQRIVDCRIWQAFVYYPWATGQFGIPPNQGTIKGGEATTAIKFGPGNTKQMDFRAAQLDAQSLDYSNPMVGKQTTTALKNKVKAYENIRNAMVKEESLRPYVNAWAGNDIQNRFNIATFSVIAALGGTLIIISVSISMIIYQVGTIFLILISPLFLLFGIHPGFGKGIALKWLELLVETVLKRIVLGIFVSVIVSVFMFLSTSSASIGYMETLLLLVVLSIAGMMYKNKFLDLVSSLNFGGTQTGLENWKDRSKGVAKSALLAGAGAGIGMAKMAPGLGKVASAASTLKAGQGATAKAASKFGRSQATKALLKSGFDGAKGSVMSKNRYTSPTLRSIRGANAAVGGSDDNKWTKALNEKQAEEAKQAEKLQKNLEKQAEREAKQAEAQRVAEKEAVREADRVARIEREQRMTTSMEDILTTLRGGHTPPPPPEVGDINGNGKTPPAPGGSGNGGATPPPPPANGGGGTNSGATPPPPPPSNTGNGNKPKNGSGATPPKPNYPPKPSDAPVVGNTSTEGAPPKRQQGGLPPKPEQKPTAGMPPKPEEKPTAGVPPKPEQKPMVGTPPKPEQKPTAGQPPKPDKKPTAGTPPKPEQKPTAGQPPKPEKKPTAGTPPKPNRNPSVGLPPKPEKKPTAGLPPKPNSSPTIGKKPGQL